MGKIEKLKQFLKDFRILYVLLGIKVLLFYRLVDFDGVDYIVSVLTFAFLAILVENMRSWKNEKRASILFGIFYTLISVIMLADSMYYGYFIQYTSVNQLFQIGNLLDTAGAIDLNGVVSTAGILLLLWDIPLAIYYFKKSIKQAKIVEKKRRKKERKFHWFCAMPTLLGISAISALVILVWNPLNDDGVRSINHLEFVTYHTSDIVKFTAGELERSSVNKNHIQQEIAELVPKATGTKYRGIAKGKNLILIQLESFQNFPIGKTYNGQELTPNINRLLEEDTLYFDHYYQSIGKGNTSDAEFATLNSFYPVTERESYRLYVDNNFNGLPWLLRAQGYATLAFHGNVRTFWNRGQMYPQEGFQTFYSQEYLKEARISGFGITDKDLFSQAVTILKQQTKPTFSFMVTVTNHIPYQLDADLVDLELKPEDNNVFGHYLQSVHYTDEAIGQLVSDLKKVGLYEDTVIAMYGDHHGMLISDEEFYEQIQESMPKFLGKDYDYDEMLHIPLIIHIPNSGVNETIHTAGGQVDFLPTIANLMDITIPQPYLFGKDLVNVEDEKDDFVASVTYLLEGSFIWKDTMYQIGRDDTFKNGRVWNTTTGESIALNDTLKEQSERARRLVELSKKVLDYNLMSDYPGQKYVLEKEGLDMDLSEFIGK